MTWLLAVLLGAVLGGALALVRREQEGHCCGQGPERGTRRCGGCGFPRRPEPPASGGEVG